MKNPDDIYRKIRKKAKDCELVLVYRRGIISKLELWLLKLMVPDLKYNPLAPIFSYQGKIFRIKDRGNLAEIIAEERFKNVCIINEKVPISTVRWRELIEYAKKSGEWFIFLKFVIVGITGILINLASFFLLYGLIGFNDLISLSVAIEISIIITYYLNDRWVFSTKRYRTPVFKRFLLYHVILLLGMGINIAVYYPLSFFMNYLLADLVGIAAASLWSFYMNNAYVFARRN